jgi:hypothetical protein
VAADPGALHRFLRMLAALNLLKPRKDCVLAYRPWGNFSAQTIPNRSTNGPYQESWGLTDVGPLSHADGGDGFWFGYEFSPSVAGGVDDVVVSVEGEV